MPIRGDEMRDVPEYRNPLWDKPIPPLWDIQQFALQQLRATWLAGEHGALNFSDCGTGKTRTMIEFVQWLRSIGVKSKVLVLGTRTILQTAWGDDIDAYTHGSLTYSVANADKRGASFAKDADFYITNHDAVTWLARPENKKIVDRLGDFILFADESTAFKTPTAARTSKALWLSNRARFCVPMTGTPMPQSILDVWSQAMMADRGKRLGNNYYRFQYKYMAQQDILVYNPRTGKSQVFKKWVAKEGAEEQVFELLKDICIRFDSSRLNLPHCEKHFKFVDLPPKAMKEYKRLEKELAIYSEQGAIEANSAASLRTKLLQLCSGSVYDADGTVVQFHKERYELALDLAEEAGQALIAFNFKHERDALVEEAIKRNLLYAVIDGGTSDAMRVRIRDMFQAGTINYVFGHPRSMGHGITMTRGRRIIWCGPTDNGESYYQFNKRIDRGGQTQENDVVMIAARDTRELRAYDGLRLKLDAQDSFNYLFAENTKNEMDSAKISQNPVAHLLR